MWTWWYHNAQLSSVVTISHRQWPKPSMNFTYQRQNTRRTNRTAAVKTDRESQWKKFSIWWCLWVLDLRQSLTWNLLHHLPVLDVNSPKLKLNVCTLTLPNLNSNALWSAPINNALAVGCFYFNTEFILFSNPRMVCPKIMSSNLGDAIAIRG